jgi:hypothetical protein
MECSITQWTLPLSEPGFLPSEEKATRHHLVCKEWSSLNTNASALILDFSASKIARKKFLLFINDSDSGILLDVRKWTKTGNYPESKHIDYTSSKE